MIRIKRIYEPPDRKDGLRVLVERLWPRGLTKERGKVDLWPREIMGVTIDTFIGFQSSDARDLRSFGALFASAVAGLVLMTASYAGTPSRLPGLTLLLLAAVLYTYGLLAKLRDIDKAERRLASGGAGGTG